MKKNNLKEKLKKEEIEKAKGYANYFIFNNKNISVNFFSNLLSQKYKTTKKIDSVVFENNEKINVLYPIFNYDNLSIQDILTIFNKVKKINIDKVIICTNNIDDKVKNFIENLPLKFIILEKFETYELIMKKFNFFPEECLKMKHQEKLSFKNLLEFAFNKKKSKGYIFASVILLISSFFVKATIYYLIICSILLIFAIFSSTNTIFNKPNKHSIF